MIHLRRVKFDSGFNVMAVCMSIEVVEETFLILQKSQYYFFYLNRSMSYQGRCFQVLILLEGFQFVHLRLEKENSPFPLGSITSFALTLFE